MTEWWSVDRDVVDMAEELISKYHLHLLDARIGLIFRDLAPVSGGKLKLGEASKVSDRWQPLLKDRYHFVIWLAHDQWAMMDKRKKNALLDHELCHCRMDYDGKVWIKPHDIEEFNEVIQRHGLWYEAIEDTALAIQGRLFDGDKPKGFVEAIVFPEVKRQMETEFDDVEVSFERST